MDFLTDKAQISACMRRTSWSLFLCQFSTAPQGQNSCTYNDCLQLIFTISRTDLQQMRYSSRRKTIHLHLMGAWTVTFTVHQFKQSPIPGTQVTFMHPFYDFSLLKAKRVMLWSSKQKSSRVNDCNINGLRQDPWLQLRCLNLESM